jgi:hypothetical protein
MLVPSFWPEKATEWIALIGGSFGALLGTSAFVLSVLNYSRDRARLQFVAKEETYYPEDESEIDADKIYIPDKVILKLRVTNLGRRPIRIDSAWALLHGLPLLLALEPKKKDADPAGIVLTESEPTAIYVSCPLDPDQLTIDGIVRFEVCDSAYRTHRHYHRNYILTLVQQARYRLREISLNRRLPKPRHVEMSELLSSAQRGITDDESSVV